MRFSFSLGRDIDVIARVAPENVVAQRAQARSDACSFQDAYPAFRARRLVDRSEPGRLPFGHVQAPLRIRPEHDCSRSPMDADVRAMMEL
jgi:hypothetical protein